MKAILRVLPLLLTVATAAESPKNIVLIQADDLGWADTTLYGNTSLYETPNIVRLAAAQTPAVRVAAAQAIMKLGDDTKLKVLVNHINDPNLLVGMFALEAIEDTLFNKAFFASVPADAIARADAYFH